MKPIQALIVDDEELARKRIRRLLAGHREVEVAGECANGLDAQRFLEEHPVDILFLDIQMPEMDGFELLARLDLNACPLVVFVTAYDDYALKAFEFHAFDYLLKPFDRLRFDKTMERALARLQPAMAGQVDERLLALLTEMQTRRGDMERLAVKNGGRVMFVRTEEIDWIEAADNYVCLHVGTETHLLRETMNAIESRLDPKRFLRIHRSTIVNLDRIKELQPWFRGDYMVILRTGAKLTLSRSYRDKLKDILQA